MRRVRRARLQQLLVPSGAYTALATISVVVLLPFIWIVLTSLKPEAELFSIPPTVIPRRVSLEHYSALLTRGDFPNLFRNSIIASSTATVVALAVGAPAAYGFARYRYRASTLVFALIVGVRMVPLVTLTIPYFAFMHALSLINSLPALIIAYLSFEVSLVVWLLEGFFRELPRDFEEAAAIDGLGPLSTFVKIVVPLSRPAIAVATALGLLTAWNEFILALTLTRTPEAQTIPVGLAGYVTSFQIFFGPMAAGATLYAIPVLLFTLVAQQNIVRGLTTGGIR